MCLHRTSFALSNGTKRYYSGGKIDQPALIDLRSWDLPTEGQRKEVAAYAEKSGLLEKGAGPGGTGSRLKDTLQSSLEIGLAH